MENRLTFIDLAKKSGFIYDDEIQYDEKEGTCNGYLMASDTLMARCDYVLKQNISEQAFKNYKEGIEYNGEVPNFYAVYDANTNDISLISYVSYVDENDVGVYSEVELPCTEPEKTLLYNALNQYSNEQYGHSLIDGFEPSKEEKNITFTDLAKNYGFIYNEDTIFNVEGNKCNAYLMASDQLMARVGFALEQTFGRELFEDFMENIKNGQDIPNFYANYDFSENKINLVSTVYFADRNGEYHYDELELLATETEQKLLLGALNEYSISLDGKDIFAIMQMFQEERNHSYDPSFEVRYSVEELEAQAEALYDTRNRNFGQFTNGELYELYKLCAYTKENPWGRSFDDEVFDEMAGRQPVDGKELCDLFYDMWNKETYIDPALKIAAECREAYANGDMATAYEKWTEINDFLNPENHALADPENISPEFREKFCDFLDEVMETFSNDEVYAITDYGKEKAYTEMENEER